LLHKFIGTDAYSYVYKAQAGSLDHALASASLSPKVTAATEWHINTDEPQIIDYKNIMERPNMRTCTMPILTEDLITIPLLLV